MCRYGGARAMRSDVPSWSRKSFVPSGSEGMLPEGGKLSYFVSGTEPQPASSQPPESVNQRHFLRGGDALAITGVVVSIFALILAATARITPLEATIQMERLAKKIESAKAFVMVLRSRTGCCRRRLSVRRAFLCMSIRFPANH